jgi:hypothetical protein
VSDKTKDPPIVMTENAAREFIYAAIKDLPESNARTMAILALGFLGGRLGRFRDQLRARGVDVPGADDDLV